LQEAIVAEDRVGGSDGKPKDDESIEVERFRESSVQQGRECACRPGSQDIPGADFPRWGIGDRSCSAPVGTVTER
jgi:hypothetical protein